MNIDHIRREKLSQIQLRRKLANESILIEKFFFEEGDVSQRNFCIIHSHHNGTDEPLLIKFDLFKKEESDKKAKIKLSIPREDRGGDWGFFAKKDARLLIDKETIQLYKDVFRKCYYTTFRTVDALLCKASNAFVQDVNATSEYIEYTAYNPNVQEKYIITIAE